MRSRATMAATGPPYSVSATNVPSAAFRIATGLSENAAMDVLVKTRNEFEKYTDVRASLEHNIREYGPYPHSFIRLVENPGRGIGAHADAAGC